MSLLWTATKWLISYIFVGVSFIVVVCAIAFGVFYQFATSPVGDPDPHKKIKNKLAHEKLPHEKLGLDDSGKVTFEGFFSIRRQYDAVADPNHNPLAPPPSTENGVPKRSNYSTMATALRVASNYAQGKKEMPKDLFYVVIKGHILYVYESEARASCLVALDISRFDVAMEDKEGAFTGIEGKMFAKRHALVMRRAPEDAGKERRGLAVVTSDMGDFDDSAEADNETLPWFFFSKANTVTEDFYIALLKRNHQQPSNSNVFSFDSMQWLAEDIIKREDIGGSGLLWLNAVLGRMFLGVCHTSLVADFITMKINKKLAQIPHIPYLGAVVTTQVVLGDVPPILTNPKLKELKADGTVVFNAHFEYKQREHVDSSGILLTIETTGSVKLKCSARIKTLKGDVEVKIKPPPSDRVWWGFVTMPETDMVLEPILLARTLTWKRISDLLEKQLREGMAEAVVLPNMDDIPFFDTSSLSIRGGIFNEAGREPAEEATESAEATNGVSDNASIKSKSVLSSAASTKSTLVSHSDDESTIGKRSLLRSETLPLDDNKKSNKSASALARLSALSTSRPASVRSEATTLVGDDKAKDKSADKVQDKPAARRSATMGDVLGRSPAIPEASDSVSTLPSYRSTPSQDDDGASINTTDTASSRVTTQTLLSAVRARDKTALSSQVNVARDLAKDSVKKWSMNWNKKKTAKEGDDDSSTPPSTASPSYFAPSNDDHQSHPPHHQRAHDGLSLQERLNAAAQKASSTSPRNSLQSSHQRQTSNASAELSVSPSASRTTFPATQPIPERSHSASESISSSPPAYQQPRAPSMVVPHVPKRPGVVTSIAHDPTPPSTPPKAKSSPSAPSLKAAQAPPKVSRGDSGPLPPANGPASLTTSDAPPLPPRPARSDSDPLAAGEHTVGPAPITLEKPSTSASDAAAASDAASI
ncbi:putative PH domain-containing protein [Vanrija pseudolonga]|uniref:Purtative PH domain-containing protein n=1 Tax=Vanrija pseudolonga TaxID=143232 RepID=A0AAF0Y138_9TREE|nr:purtative PH domain-containing protein [Vanrija pseudolonga]